MRKTVAILGIPIDDLDMEEVLERMDGFVESRRFHQVATANTDFLVKALGDEDLRATLLVADMVIPDGMPIVMASRWLGAGLRERVTGADLVPRLAERAAEKGYRIFMLGAREDVAVEARRKLEERFPSLRIVGQVSPPVASIAQMDNDAILAQITEAKPDILLVAFGNPKQEMWISLHRDRLQVPICIGVGGTFDFIAGSIARAPTWVQRAGMEWFYRICQEPGRLWKRYAVDIWHFARLIVLQIWFMRRRGGGRDSRITKATLDGTCVISIRGLLDQRLLPELQEIAGQALDSRAHLVLDLHAATQIDSAVLGTLLNLPKRAAYVGRDIRLVGVSGRVRQALEVTRSIGSLKIFATLAEALDGGDRHEPQAAVIAEAEERSANEFAAPKSTTPASAD